MVAPSRVLIADASPPMHGWLARAVRGAFRDRVPELCGVADGAELLDMLAEGGPHDLVVTQALLPGMSGAQVLATVRTAGLQTPFLLLDYLPTRRLRSLVSRVGRAYIVDDPLDAGALRDGIWRLIRESETTRASAPSRARAVTSPMDVDEISADAHTPSGA